jgi:antitoxin MazE
MEIDMKVSKWGNSLAIRLPAELVDELSLRDGDEVDIRRLDRRALGLVQQRSKEELRDRLRALRGRMPKGFKFDRNEIYDA